MAKRIINLVLGVLLTITIFISTFTLTLLNANFIKMNLRKTNYYEEVYHNIIDDLEEYDDELEYSLNIDDVEDDINAYVKSRYDNKYFKLPMDIDDDKVRDIYNANIKFNNIFKDYNMIVIVYGIYFVDIVLIIITGLIFIKTKNNHNITTIMIISAVLSIFIYGICYIINNIGVEIFYNIVNTYLHYYLGINIMLLEYAIFKKIKK